MNNLYCYYCSKHSVNFHSPIINYHYNEQYNLWTIVLVNNDIFFIYDKNIHKLSIIDDEEELYGLCVNGKTKVYKPMEELNND